MTTTAPTGRAGNASASYPIASDEDVVRFRHQVRAAAVSIGMRLVDQTKLVTAASELARNALEHGGGGQGEVEVVGAHGAAGVRLLVEDDGPGIADVELALVDGYSGAGIGMGLGLPGARRLVDVFEIWSQVGVGTCVTVEKWT